MRLSTLALSSAVIALAAGAAHAQETPRHFAALVAGYKASFLCSGAFDAGQSEAQITADDLGLIYQEYREPIAKLPAAIDREAKTVSVPFAPDMPPRIAAFRPNLGCTTLPIGAGPDAIAKLPTLKVSAPPSTDGLAWPMGDRDAVAKLPKAKAKAVDALIASAFDHATYGQGSETTAVIVVKDGKIVAERYREGYDLHTPQRTWSAGKSLAGTLIGIGVRDGLLKVDEPAPVPEWRKPADPRGKITLANLLHMGSGLYAEKAGNRTDQIYVGGATVAEKAAAQPLEAAPGTRWQYANDDTLLALRSLRAAVGDDDRYLAFPFQELFWKIGMRRTFPETDWNGDFIMSSQVWTTARDLARFGLLYQNDGVWNGERIIPSEWVKYVATPAPAQPDKGPGYGAQFWLYGAKDGLPEGTYAARGNRGQYVFIVPSKKLVVVRRGFDAVGPGGEQFEVARFTRDVIAAVE
ncbi:serine hydrolase [Caulobacter sp. 17J80-11]|uniref:serine hydrolase domain-containing protein n=1 Tax=Caulobacter sp. 17J80-11 TaxID=2763502 RepID=UPI001653E9DD|nr:serine hydrolase [Caulobacter sp. 17J80-11]MBC6982225.1 serine hydrolase [Caulobacter sp. 17J80-11]